MRLAPRFTIPGLMAVVLVVSLSLAALLNASATWAGGLYLVTHGILMLAVVGAVCRGPSERAWWLGFAVFGLVCLREEFLYGQARITLPTTLLLQAIKPHAVKPEPETLGDHFVPRTEYYWVVGRCLWSLLAAALGGTIAHALFSAPAGPPAAPDAGQERQGRGTWRRLAAVALLGLVAGLALVVVGARSDPALWVGAVYMLTWAVLGFAALGFACGHGRRRMVWFGAALFGLAYLLLNRGPDGFEQRTYGHLVADQFLNALRPWLPPLESGFPADTADVATENLRIKKALDRPVPARFREAPLGEFLDDIRAATQTSKGGPIQIYVDPVGLQEAEKTLQSPVQLDLEGRPLRTTLHLALRQLGMVYYIRDGIVHITALGNEDIPVVVDYYLLLGHCVLALVAAALGALLVPLASARADDRRSAGQAGTGT